jgi:Ca2+-binding EF-hand superfamily protein
MNRVFKQFKGKAENRKLLFQDTFRILCDHSLDSKIGTEEILKALDSMQLHFNAAEKQALVDKITKMSNGNRLSYVEFFKVIEGTSTWNITQSITQSI